jgi:hypothetical protein
MDNNLENFSKDLTPAYEQVEMKSKFPTTPGLDG